MGHPVHPKGFRVGKSLPWHFASHRYDFDPASTLIRQLVITRLLRRRFLRFFPLRRFGLVPAIPRITINQGVLRVIFPVFNSSYDIFLRRYRFQHFFSKHKRPKRRWRRRVRGGLSQQRANRRYKGRVRRYLRAIRIWRRRCFGKNFLMLKQAAYHTPRLKLPRWHRRALRRDPNFKPRPRLPRPGKKKKLNFKKFPHTSMKRFFLDPMSKGRFRRQTPFRLRRRFAIMVKCLQRQIRMIWPQRIQIRLLPLNFANTTAKILASYVVRRFRLGYKVNRIVYPLLAEARRMPGMRGLFFRFKGRLTRKARASLNSRSFRYGRIGFSTVDAFVDYASQPFETRYGVCTVQVWIAHCDRPEEEIAAFRKKADRLRLSIPLFRKFGSLVRAKENKAEYYRLNPDKIPKPAPVYPVRKPWDNKFNNKNKWQKGPWNVNKFDGRNRDKRWRPWHNKNNNYNHPGKFNDQKNSASFADRRPFYANTSNQQQIKHAPFTQPFHAHIKNQSSQKPMTHQKPFINKNNK